MNDKAQLLMNIIATIVNTPYFLEFCPGLCCSPQGSEDKKSTHRVLAPKTKETKLLQFASILQCQKI